MAQKIKVLQGDRILWGAILMLLMISLVAVSSAGGALSVRTGGNISGTFVKHIQNTIFGGFALFLGYNIPLAWIKKLTYPILGLSILLVIATLIYGKTTNDATRWLVMPFVGAIQTSEIAKAALVIYLAAIADKYYNNAVLYEKHARIVHGVTVGVIAMIFIHNLSTAVLIYAIIITMMAITKLRTKLLIRFVSLTFIVAFGYSFIAQQLSPEIELPGRMDTWEKRFGLFFHPEHYENESRQPDAAQINILEGAFNPAGPGKSTARYVLSQAQSDYIYALIIGEMSIFVGIFVLILYFVIFYRGVLIVQRSETVFPAFLALGFTLMITMQAFMHIAVTVGLGPVTGQPLPLVSMGGTSMLVSGFAMGVLLNASAKINMEEVQKRKKNQTTANPSTVSQTGLQTEQEYTQIDKLSEPTPKTNEISEQKTSENTEMQSYHTKHETVTEPEFSVTTKKTDFYIKSNYTLNEDEQNSSHSYEPPKHTDFTNSNHTERVD